MAESEARKWVLIWVENLHRRARSKRFWVEGQERLDLDTCCLILSCLLNKAWPTEYANCNSGMGIDKSRCFSVKQAVHPC